MADWNLDTLRKLDRLYAEAGIAPHQRPLRAAAEILGESFSLGVGGDPEVKRITDAYTAMLPEVRSTWPGMGTGIAAVVDQVKRVTVPVVYGSLTLQPWRGLGFESDRAWWGWCREDRAVAAATCFAFADLHDMTYGVRELRLAPGDGTDLWRMAASNLSDVSNILPGTFSVDSVIQPICLAVELSLKAALVRNGADPTSFGRRGGEGHDLKKLAARLALESPHRDDALVARVAAAMPPYVNSRYAPAGLTRLQVVDLALGAQFVVASTVRRFSDRDLAADMERGDFPGPRRTQLD